MTDGVGSYRWQVNCRSEYKRGFTSEHLRVDPEDTAMVFMMGDATGTGVSQQAGRVIKLTVSLEESRMSSKSDQGIQAVPYVPPKQISCMFSQQIRGRWLMNRFYLNETSVSQCEPVEVYWDESAVSPVRVLGVIPQGQIFEFSSIGEAASMGMSP